MNTRLARTALAVCIASGLSWCQVTIVAASEFRPALEEIRKAFQEQTGIPTRVTYGSSGAMAHRAKAPGTDIFLSSNKGWTDSLAATARADEGPIVLGAQPVCVWVRGSGLEPSANLEHLAEQSPGSIVLADTLLSPDAEAVIKILHGMPNWKALRERLVVVADDAIVVDSLSRHSAEITKVVPRDTAPPPPPAVKDSMAVTTEPSLKAAETPPETGSSYKKRILVGGKGGPEKDSASAYEAMKNASATSTNPKSKKKVVVVIPKTRLTLSNGFLPQSMLWNSPLSGPLAGTGRWTPVNSDFVPLMLSSVIRLKSLNAPRTDAAKAFLAFLQAPRSRSILRSNGFLPPP